MCVLCGCPGCGADDYLESDTSEFNLSSVPTNQGTANYKWNNDVRGQASGEITWSMNLAGLSIVAGSQIEDFRQATRDAFDTWAAVAGLSFRFTGSATGSDIDIDVASLSGNAIGVANTFYNPNDANRNGLVEIAESNISMGADETWIANGLGGAFTFFQVMLHEIGHALGLDHFNVSDSIMNATANSGSRTLGDDDIAGIQNLYGAKQWSNAGEEANYEFVGVAQNVMALGGNDMVTGSLLSDNINGGAGQDRLYGLAGNDTLNGGTGNDTIVDLRGDNDLFGGADNDTIVGGGGTIDAEGNEGDDTIIGGIGADTLDGGDGNDILRGDPTGSFVSGNDTLIAGQGNDVLEGGGGADTFVFDASDGANRITDFERGFDVIDLVGGLDFGQGTLTTSGANSIWTHNGGGLDLTITIEGVFVDASDFM